MAGSIRRSMGRQILVFALNLLIISSSSATCTLPHVPTHGQLILDKQGLGTNSTATFLCAEGYMLVGEETVLCLRNGQWSGEGQRCDDSSQSQLRKSEVQQPVHHKRKRVIDNTSLNVTVGVCSTFVVVVFIVFTAWAMHRRRRLLRVHPKLPVTHFWRQTCENHDKGGPLTNNYTTV